MEKTKIMICREKLHSLKDSGNTFMVSAVKGLVVNQSSVVDVSLGYKRNKVDVEVD